MLVDKTKKHRAKDVGTWIESEKANYPFRCEIPYTGYPKDIPGNYIWTADRETATATFMFDDENDRNALAALHVTSRRPAQNSKHKT